MINKYTSVRIQYYLEGKLSPQEMYQLEREALDDPLLQDAIDGYREAERVDERRLSALQKRLEDRITTKGEQKQEFYFSWQRLSVAATAGLLFILACILLWMIISRNEASSHKEKKVDVELTQPADPDQNK